MLFALLYSCGLRVGEAVRLEVRDVHASQGRIHVREAKGGKDRFVPLPASLLARLRQYWATHRHPRLLFPGAGCAWRERGQEGLERTERTDAPMSVSSVQHCFRLVCARAGLKATCHAAHVASQLRDASAGGRGELAPDRELPRAHVALDTTVIYTHLTAVSEGKALAVIERLTQAAAAAL